MDYRNQLSSTIEFKSYESREEGYIGLVVVGDAIILSSKPKGPRPMPRPIMAPYRFPVAFIPSPKR